MQVSSQRIGAWGWRLSVVALAASLVTIVHSAARSTPPGRVDPPSALAKAAGDFSDRSLKSLIAGMDPATAAIAARYDPAIARTADPHLPGWPTYDLTYTPLFDFSALQADDARRINQLLPATSVPITPAQPFVLQAKNGAERERAVRCLANAIYYEAALESADGQRAVAQVVLNRVRDPNFPKSVCGVVYEGWERPTGCQFSFTCNNALLSGPIAALYDRTRKIAEEALKGAVMAQVGTATHYHADYVAPYWGPTLTKITQIGAHIFYRWPGSAGDVGAFVGRYQGGELNLSEAVLTGRAPRATPIPGAEIGPPAAQLLLASAQTQPADTGPQLPGRRRKATPEEIARINALLQDAYPLQTSTALPAGHSAPPPVPVASAASAPAGG